MNNDILSEWLHLIENKENVNIKLDSDISNLFNKLTKLKYIICFDVEFLRYVIKYKQIQTIHEMGGIIFLNINNEWYLYSIFHLNLVPILKNINQYYLLTSNYNTTSDDTNKQLIENEKILLPEHKINESNYEEILSTDPIIKLYIKPKELNILLKNKNIDIIKRKIEKIKYMIKGYDLMRLTKAHKLFIENVNLILHDSDSKAREIKETNKFINLTNQLFSQSYLIVKGLEDIKALKNHTILLKENYIILKHIFDISKYNNILFEMCNSARLEETYICIKNMNLLDNYQKYFNVINNFTAMKAHNPLVDAYYTFIIFIIFKLDKIKH